ncbi:MAG: metal ABC transporter permease [Clostridia bacterium]|nr:metal ABC transporter permease [Clostridia bacterium]
MTTILQTLSEYLSYSFVRYALIVGVLVSLCASLFGVVLVLRRFSFIGDGLSHVAFGALAVASVMKLTNDMLIVLPVTILAAILLLRTGRNAKIKGDAAVAMVSVGALALGYLIMSLFSASANVAGDVCSTLFGSFSIITLSQRDVWLCIVLSITVIALFLLFYHKIFSVTFDEEFAAATGVRTGLYQLLTAVITAVIIVLAMNLVGSLLISALVVFPSLSAMRLCKSFRGVTICSAVLSVLCALAGLFASILLERVPVGPTIVAANLIAFLICSVVGAFLRRIKL